MITQRIDLWQEGEYTYPMACGFMPNIRTYLHEDDQIRPAMVVVPGGAYAFVAPTEAGIIAEKFYDFGYNAFVVTYSINLLGIEPLRDQSARDLSRAIRLVRANHAEWKVDPEKLAICGFSAGGHLCASVCVHFRDLPDAAYPEISNRPDAAILSYPVITSGEKAHRGSFNNLIGEDADAAMLQYVSLETQVSPETPPCFLWHTATDELVPVENSYYFAEALQKNKVPYALHIFSEGPHGLSLADERWAGGDFGGDYTMEPTQCIVNAIRSGQIEVSDAVKEMLAMFENGPVMENHPNPEVQIWPELARTWLKKILQ